MDSPLLAEPGAVPAEGPDAGVAAHYGDPLAEQRGIAAGWGVVDASHRGVVRIAGPDRLSWLHSLTTQHLDQLPSGGSAQALILDAQGHVEHEMTLTDDGEAIWAHTEPGAAAALAAFLDSMRFMLRVEVADVSADYAVVTILGPGRPGLDGRLAVHDRFESSLFAARAAVPDEIAALRATGAILSGTLAYEALRIVAGRPRFGLDNDGRALPHELGWIGTAVHLDKGCYRGQETVARIHNLGHPPRRLVRLLLDGSEDRLPGHGDPVTLDGGQVGFTGSAARHYELGPVALALVRRNVPVDATLAAAGIPAAQEVIVAPDAGGQAADAVRRVRAGLLGRGR